MSYSLSPLLRRDEDLPLQTRCLELDPAHPDPGILTEAARLLRQGEPVAFPTETVYGLGANALDPRAVSRIYEAKGRPATNPLIVHVSDLEQARELVLSWPASLDRLVSNAWPGPLTVVLPRSRRIPDIVTAGQSHVGIRIPAHPVARALLGVSGIPLAAPSANRSEHISPTRAWHVMASLGGRIPLILDGGACQVGIESTVIRREPDDTLTVLRPGMITPETLRAWSGMNVRIPEGPPEAGKPLPSPGQDLRHYAPDTPTSIVQDVNAVSGWSDLRLGVLACEPEPTWFTGEWIRLPAQPGAYASELYDGLHRLDHLALSRILIVAPPRSEDWSAIWDRLQRADDRTVPNLGRN